MKNLIEANRVYYDVQTSKYIVNEETTWINLALVLQLIESKIEGIPCVYNVIWNGHMELFSIPKLTAHKTVEW